MCKSSDPVAQRIHRENAERMLVASFVGCLVAENSADGIVSGERNFDWEVLKQLCDIFGLFLYVVC